MKIQTTFLFILIYFISYSQKKEYQIFRTNELITVDGIIDEQVWKDIIPAKDFIQNYPTDSLPAETKTEVKLCFDDKYLYVSAICYNNSNTNYVVNSFIRDFSFPKTDAFAIFLSPLKDKTNGLSFSVNPYNVQRDGLISSAGSWGVTTAWNQKWLSEVKRYDNYWTLEMALPLSILKYKKNNTEWDLNFARNNLKTNETSTWNKVDFTYNVASIMYYGNLIWKDGLPKAKPNISFMPFLSVGAKTEIVNSKNLNTKNLSKIGLDAKLGVTSTLDLDITINPDFSNTEVDAQEINIDRFSLFLPEKRPFFTENSDMFSRFGFSSIRPFFSRRIGLESNILGGVRLSGNLTNDLRIGLMNIQTEGALMSKNLESQNHSVVVFQQKVLSNSNIGGIFVNKQAFHGYEYMKGQNNTLGGLDFNYYSKNGKWNGKTFYHQGFDDKIGISNSASAIWLSYNDSKWNFNYNHEFVGEDYNAEVGFVPRNGYFRFEHDMSRKIYVKNGKINYHYIKGYYSQYWEKGFFSTDRVYALGYNVIMKNTSKFGIVASSDQTKLTKTFDIVGKGTPIETGTYNYTSALFYYNSNYRKTFTYSGSIDYGQFYNGIKTFYTAQFNYNFRPKASIGISVNRNELRFSGKNKDGYFTLIGTQFKYSFTTDIHWATFLQYNTQADNFNVNSRIQWRFAPMSDIFLTYSNNYDTALKQKNRALVLRINRWF